MLIEMVMLFDLLVVVACFGVLVRYLVSPRRQYQQPRTAALGGLTMAAAPSRHRRIATGRCDPAVL